MVDIARAFIREPQTGSPAAYSRRVHLLALTYSLLFGLSAAGLVVLVVWGKLFVTLAQRSNVETLVLLFLAVYFLYLASISLPGLLGAVRVAYYALLARISGPDRAEARKARALPPPADGATVAALNVRLELAEAPDRPFKVEVRDRFGSMGWVAVDGVEIRHAGAPRPSNSLLGYFVSQVNAVLSERGLKPELDILSWKQLDDELTDQYVATVRFARNLERHLGARELWPRLALTPRDLEAVTERLAAVCPALRSETFLPDWEYSGEHKLPLIPEPLGIISLARTERRVDPVASMGCAVLIVLFLVGTLALLVLIPPWVPGK